MVCQHVLVNVRQTNHTPVMVGVSVVVASSADVLNASTSSAKIFVADLMYVGNSFRHRFAIPVWKSKFYGAFMLNHRVGSTPSTRRLLDGVAVCSPPRSTEPGRPRRRRDMT